LSSIKLLLIDQDPIFRLGLCAALTNSEFPDLEVIAQGDSVKTALELLSQQLPDVVILDLGKPPRGGVQICDRLLRNYPGLRILLLSANPQLEDLRAAKAIGVLGFCTKGTDITEIVTAIRQVVSGQPYWPSLPKFSSKISWLSLQSLSGIQQIEASLTVVEDKLKNSKLPLFDWLFWSGRQRELKTARWLINQLVPVEVIVVQENLPPSTEQTAIIPGDAYPSAIINYPENQANDIFQNIKNQINLGLDNRTGTPLEIDILLPEKKEDLLNLVLTEVAKELREIKTSKIIPENLLATKQQILREIWQASSIHFISKYSDKSQDLNLIDQVMEEGLIVEKEILNKIGLFEEILEYLVLEKGLLIEKVEYPYTAPEVKERAEILLENLIIKIANGAMQVVLNNYSEDEKIKANLYKPQYKSSREIAKFRNNFSWKYQQEKYWEEPKNIFEDKHKVLYLERNKIKKTYVYASRKKELEQLRGIPWSVTIAIEARDAIAPRLRAVVDFLGEGVVYILTEVIGRAIGLIGKGIIQGVGNTLQETRMRKK